MKSALPTYLTHFTPVLFLETVYPRTTQHRIRALTGLGMVGGTLLYGAIPVFELPLNQTAVLAGALIMAGLYTEQVLLGLYHNYYYFRGLDSHFGKGNHQPAPCTYDAAKVILHNPNDITKALLTSTFGQHIYLRCGITADDIDTFLSTERTNITYEYITAPTTETVSIISLVETLLTNDHSLRTFLEKNNTSVDTFRAVTRLIMTYHYTQKRRERWWSRDALSHRGSIGRKLAFGTQHTHIPYTNPLVDDLTTRSVISKETMYVEQIATILAGRKDAHLLLVGEEGNGLFHVLRQLAVTIQKGTVLHALTGHHIIQMDIPALTAHSLSPADTERALHSLYQSAILAGNIVLVIPNIAQATAELQAKGVDFMTITDGYIADYALHIIGTSLPLQHQQVAVLCPRFLKRATELTIANPTESELVAFLGNEIISFEGTSGVYFTYQALMCIAEAAIRFDTPTYETAMRILQNVAIKFPNTIITDAQVSTYISETEGITLGAIKPHEQHLLLHLEEILNTYVIGQARASAAIATCIRRIRTDLHDITTPTMSLLFLGPSGVGKTEMAKALATVYRRNEAALVRFDMSEFAHSDLQIPLLERLAKELSHNPHAIILFDEFEKADTTIKHLFLQMLDEGVVTTPDGLPLNFRNTIIIATSNAGSDMIARTSEQRAHTPVLDTEIAEYIVRQGLISRELLNRFSEVVLFDPLTKEAEKAIAIITVGELTARLKNKGFGIHIESSVLDAMVTASHNPTYGARPLKHHIEKTVDDIVATRIIRGVVKPGDTIHITMQDYTSFVQNTD